LVFISVSYKFNSIDKIWRRERAGKEREKEREREREGGGEEKEFNFSFK